MLIKAKNQAKWHIFDQSDLGIALIEAQEQIKLFGDLYS